MGICATKKPGKAVGAETADPAPGASFPVVGIGASAGGLEALEQFLENVPPESGIAFVIVQHLDPTRKGIMPELLLKGRSDNIKILELVPPAKRTIGLAIPEGSRNSPATQRFAEYIITWLKSQE